MPDEAPQNFLESPILIVDIVGFHIAVFSVEACEMVKAELAYFRKRLRLVLLEGDSCPGEIVVTGSASHDRTFP